MLVLNSKLGELKSELLTESNKLEAKVDFFNSRYREFAVTCCIEKAHLAHICAVPLLLDKGLILTT